MAESKEDDVQMEVEMKPEGNTKIEDLVQGVSNLAATAASSSAREKEPCVLLMVGMAGTGKTSLTQRVVSEILRRKQRPYIINLDPACHDPPFHVTIDIRDTVKYKSLMKDYKLGPNGAIVTALNLFSTKFNEVLDLIKKRRKEFDFIVVDTPGQIEVFMWSASGSIIADSLAATFPTVMVYVTDLVTNSIPVTFMSNMSYACSMVYRAQLPFILALNKCDAADAKTTMEWINDFEAFEAVVRNGDDYMDTLCSSMALVLDEFYNQLQYVAVSAKVGLGMDEFFKAIEKGVEEYYTVYKPHHDKVAAESKRKAEIAQRKRKKSPEGESIPIESMISVDAGAGLTLSLNNDDDDDDSSSCEGTAEQCDEPDEEFKPEVTVKDVYDSESDKRHHKLMKSSVDSRP